MKALSLVTLTVGALVLAGCTAPDSGTPQDDGIVIVASTNVYGSIAEAVGGDLVTVTSLITGAAQDPHSFEASAQDQLAISRADVVIENGGGYDPFIDRLLEASGSTAVVLTAVDEEHAAQEHGHEEDEHADDEHTDDEHADDQQTAEEHAATEEQDDGHGHIEGFNEHVWYDLHTVEDVADRLASILGDLDAANAGIYEANAAAFAEGIEELEARAEALHDRVDGLGVAVTEPVPLYLLEEIGLVNLTPEDFTEAIEEGSDVPPAALRATLDVIAGGRVVLLAYNEQTASPETERVRDAAEAAGIPVVSFTETLPDGEDYLSWMTANLDLLEAALPR